MQCKDRRKVLRLNHKLQRHPKCPFRRTLHANKDTEVLVEDAELPTNLFTVKNGETQSQGKGQCDNKPFSQQFGISCANTRFRFTKHTPIHKESSPWNKNTSGPSSKKTKILSKVLGKINERPKYIVHYTRVSDTLQKKTLPKIKKSEGDRHVQGSEDSGKPGNFRHVEKKGNKGMSTSPKSVCEHPLFSRQEGWGQSSCDKL